MDDSLTLSVLIEGPSGSAEFNRGTYLDPDKTVWVLGYSTLEELPMPGGEDL
jgi:hypothetical protein